jgi:Alginate export
MFPVRRVRCGENSAPRRSSPAVLLAALTALAPAAATAEPWTLSKALGAPENVGLDGSYRVRYETLDGTFRAGRSGSDDILVERLLLSARYDFQSIYVGAELQDSRAQLADSDTPIGTDDVNAFELLRAYVGYRRNDVLQDADELDLVLGRMTIDAGSRRLVARNRFRNTINAFAGLRGQWTGAGGDRVQMFFTLPVERLPADVPSLLDNDVEFDREDDSIRFWGIHYTKPQALGNWTGELYLFGLREHDGTDRELYTPGFRLFVAPVPGAFDYEIETAVQFGKSRLSALNAGPLLDHFAHFHHAHIGYTADNAWQTRFALQYDYASGDDDLSDSDNGRFDTLFGARRSDFGPTGIYGAFGRSNISSPGIWLGAEPRSWLDGFVGYRAVYLASGSDVLATAGLQDSSDRSGRFLGHQLETRINFVILPDNLELELGAVRLLKGRFFETAPNVLDTSDTTYFYAHVELTL